MTIRAPAGRMPNQGFLPAIISRQSLERRLDRLDVHSLAVCSPWSFLANGSVTDPDSDDSSSAQNEPNNFDPAVSLQASEGVLQTFDHPDFARLQRYRFRNCKTLAVMSPQRTAWLARRPQALLFAGR